MSEEGSAESASVAIEALPSTGIDVPGLWVVATESGTRYVIAVPPEGPARAVRWAFYGYDRGQWRPYLGSWSAHSRGTVPITIGSPAVVQFTETEGDWYLSTTVTAIEQFVPSALLEVESVERGAEAAMRSRTVTLVAEAVQAGKVRDEQELADLCAAVGVAMSDVVQRLGPDVWQVASQAMGPSPTPSAPATDRRRRTGPQSGLERGELS